MESLFSKSCACRHTTLLTKKPHNLLVNAAKLFKLFLSQQAYGSLLP